MPQEKKSAIQFVLPFIWMMTGILSWYLSFYLYSYVMSPLLIGVVRETNALTQSVILRNTANMLFSNIADFSLCFFFSMLLGFFTRPTRLGLPLFILGAIAVSLYELVENLMNYIWINSEFPAWAAASLFQGLISMLLIIPLLSFAGCRTGHRLRLRRSRA